MENPRPEKVAVVDEVRERLESAGAALLTEYRGLERDRDRRAAPRAAGRPAATTRSTRTRSSASLPVTSASSWRTCSPAPRPSPSSPSRRRPVTRSTWPRRCATSPGPTRTSSSRAACWARSCSPPTRPRRWPTWRPVRCCSPSSPARSPPRMVQFAGLLAGAAPQLRLRPQGPHRPAGRRPPTTPGCADAEPEQPRPRRRAAETDRGRAETAEAEPPTSHRDRGRGSRRGPRRAETATATEE